MIRCRVSFRCVLQCSYYSRSPAFIRHLTRPSMPMTSIRNHDAGSSYTTAINPSSARPILLVIDFDGTLTMRDTMHLVADAGYAHQKASKVVPQPTPWSDIVDAYMADFKSHASNYEPRASERTSPDQESAWLSSLKEIEEASVSRACAAGVFDNVAGAEMEEAGQRAVQDGRVRLRAGWHGLLAKAHEHNARTSSSQLPCRILSVNWSSAFIQGVVRQASEEQQMTKLPALNQHVYANEIPSIMEEANSDRDNASSSTRLQIIVRTSNDKVKLLQNFRNHECTTDDALLIYVGDSSTDLDCLLEADLGFVIHDEPLGSGQKDLAETCRRIGIDIQPSSRFKDQCGTERHTLVSVQDFSQIRDYLEKNSIVSAS